MGPPAITRRRRPFLTPVWLILLAALAVLGVGLGLHESANNTIVVVVPPASGELGTIDDPPLSATGEQQAQQLAQQFAADGSDGLAAIYVSASRRAKQTAAPLAQSLGKQPVTLTSSDADGIAGQIMGEHGGDNVLVVCAEAVIPDLIQVLSGQQVKAPEGQRSVWVVTVPSYGPATVLRMAY